MSLLSVSRLKTFSFGMERRSPVVSLQWRERGGSGVLVRVYSVNEFRPTRAKSTCSWTMDNNDIWKKNIVSLMQQSRFAPFRCIPVPLLAYFHVSLLALRMQPQCEAAAGTSANKRGEKIATRRLHPTFLFYTGAYRRLIKRKLLTDLPFDPSLDQQEVIQFTFGSTSLCLAFKYAADVSPLLSFFFFITALPHRL